MTKEQKPLTGISLAQPIPIHTPQRLTDKKRIESTVVLFVFIILLVISLGWVSMTFGWIRSKEMTENDVERRSLIQSRDSAASRAVAEALKRYDRGIGASN